MTMSPATELMSFLTSLLPPLRRTRQFGTVLNIEVAQEITADVVAQHKQLSGLAYTAEQADLEAAKMLTTVLADHQVTPDEIPLLTRALAHINRSAGHDRRLSNELTA